jgi:hypothetical protein
MSVGPEMKKNTAHSLVKKDVNRTVITELVYSLAERKVFCPSTSIA